MIDPARPPKARPGYRWEWREGCDCKTCPWKGNCLGETREHWREVPDAGLTNCCSIEQGSS